MAIECSICGKKQSGWIQEYSLDAELYDYKACVRCGETYQKIIRAEKLRDVAEEIEFIKEKLAENCSNVDKNVEKHFEMIFKVENAEKSYKEVQRELKQQTNEFEKDRPEPEVRQQETKSEENLNGMPVGRRENIAQQQKIEPQSIIKKKNPYELNYEKVLSSEEKREWIENYVNIKRFVSLVWACLGLGIGFFVGRLLGYGMDFTMFVLILIGGGIGGILGTNSVGAAMMNAIAAEQSIVNEELLTEILNKLEDD